MTASNIIDPKRVLIGAPVAMGVAVIANAALLFLAKASHTLYSVNWQGAGAPASELPLVPVVVASAAPVLAGALLFAALAKFAPARALLLFEILAAVAVIASFASPLLLPATTSFVSKIVLCAMHVLAGAAAVGVLGTMGVKRSDG